MCNLYRDMSVSLSSERDAVLELGHEIIDHTHNGMRVFPSSLVATIVMQCKDGIPFEELIRRVESLRAEILARGGTVHWITSQCRAIKHIQSYKCMLVFVVYLYSIFIHQGFC